MSTDRNGRPIPPGRTRAIVNPGVKSRQSLERSRGITEPIDPDRHYIVTPGEGTTDDPRPEYWPKEGQSTLTGLEDAITRAAWLSMSRDHQVVIRISPDSDPKVIRRYTGGNNLTLVQAGEQA
jgi:hypothetical protein